MAFYKSVMAPGSVEQGLRIEKFDLAATSTEGEFAFRLVLTQVGDNRNNIAGDGAAGGGLEISADGGSSVFVERIQVLNNVAGVTTTSSPDPIRNALKARSSDFS